MSKLISLTKGKFAVVDDQDFKYLSQFKWHCLTAKYTSYAVRKTRETGKFRGTILMHREIIQAPNNSQVDHIDMDGLNNTRANLRNVSAFQNRQNRGKTSANSSGYKGIKRNYSCKSSERWYSVIVVKGNSVYLGSFGTPKEAAKAYDEAATEYFGEFARLNFQEENNDVSI